MNTIYISCATLMSIASLVPAMAGEIGCLNSPQSNPLSGSIYAGYASNYEHSGLVFPAIEDSVGLFGLSLKYAISEKDALVAFYNTQVLDGNSNESNTQSEQFMGVGYQNTGWVPNTTCTIGYDLYHWGAPGIWALEGGSEYALVQEFFMSTETDLGSGFDWINRVSYAFYGLTGWWFNTEVGWTYKMCERASIRPYAGVAVAASYYNDANNMSGGWQSVTLGVEMPMELMKNLTLTPFVDMNWGANGALKANRIEATHVIKPFAVVAGARVQYSF